jgi:hypothetical protein
MKNKSKNLADQLFPEIIEVDNEILNIPPEQRKLNTETYDFTVSTINDYIKEKHIVIPKFQRGYVWNRSQASRLIESLIIQCPIPVVFLSQNSDETLSVIDGNQRLNSINLFLEEDFYLQGLTAYPELDGFKFSELDPRFQRHIKNRTIRCIVILKDTHPQIKFDVFERLNTGSVKLNAQELRHGVHHGSLMNLLEKVSKYKGWKDSTGFKTDKRMKGEELILRFFALSDNWRNYLKPMSGYLSAFSEKNRNLEKDELDTLEQNLYNVITTIIQLYGNLAFRSYDKTLKNAKFNTALFDAQSIALHELDLSDAQINKLKKKDIIQKTVGLFDQDEFSKFISQATTDKNAVQGRIRQYKKFIENLL